MLGIRLKFRICTDINKVAKWRGLSPTNIGFERALGGDLHRLRTLRESPDTKETQGKNCSKLQRSGGRTGHQEG